MRAEPWRRDGAYYRRWSMEFQTPGSENGSDASDAATPQPKPRTTRRRTPKAAVVADAEPATAASPTNGAAADGPVTELSAVEAEPRISPAIANGQEPVIEAQSPLPEPAITVEILVEPLVADQIAETVDAPVESPPMEPPATAAAPDAATEVTASHLAAPADSTGTPPTPPSQPVAEPSRYSDQGSHRGFSRRPDRRERHVDLPPRDGPMFNVTELDSKSITELHEIAKELSVPNYQRYRKADLIGKILQAQTEAQGFKYGEGVLDIIEDGFGFLRGERYLPGPEDIYVSQSQIRRFGLRTGDKVSGQIRPPKDNEKFHSLLRVEAVNGIDPETARRRPNFDTLTPIFPLELIDLETQPHILDTVAQPCRPHRPRAARADRFAAKGRQDSDPQGDRQRNHEQL